MSGYDDYTRYMSADTEARREETDKLITNSFREIEKKNEILRGLKRLSDENRLDQVLERCEELSNYPWNENDELYDYLQQELNVTFNMRDENVRDKELGDVLFYYLLRDEEPVPEIGGLIGMMSSAAYIGWYYMCTQILGWKDIIFTQFYKQLRNKPQHLEYLIYKHPQLLFEENSTLLINKLNIHLPHDNLHQILLNTRDESGGTFLLYHHCYVIDDEVYRNKFDDLYELLSVLDEYGDTALHMEYHETAYILLKYHITLKNQGKMNELLSIEDDNDKTVYDKINCRRKDLTWLKRQYEHNNYPLYWEPQVLILYNTNEREGAEKEAESIQQAFESLMYESDRIEMKEMGTKREVLKLITQKAADWRTSVLIVCLMSHGNIGTIEDSKMKPITLTSIERAMCSAQLKKRPKILITQSCQTRAEGKTYADEGTNTDITNEAGERKRKRKGERKRKRKGGRKRKDEVEDKLVKKRKLAKTTHDSLRGTTSQSSADPGSPVVPNSPYEPSHAHFLSVQTCVSEQVSYRGVFIPYLAEQINQRTLRSSSNDSFVDLVEKVNLRMDQERSERFQYGPQIPILKSTLGGKVCLKDQFRMTE